MADTGPAWHTVIVERSKVYFWTFSASSVNFVCLMNLLAFTGLRAEISICLIRSIVEQLCKSAMSHYAFNASVLWSVCCYDVTAMWHKLFGCHLNYLYTPLLDVKIGLLCSAAQQIFHSLRINLNIMRLFISQRKFDNLKWCCNLSSLSILLHLK